MFSTYYMQDAVGGWIRCGPIKNLSGPDCGRPKQIKRQNQRPGVFIASKSSKKPIPNAYYLSISGPVKGKWALTWTVWSHFW